MKNPIYTLSEIHLSHNGFLPIEKATIKATFLDKKSTQYTRERVLRADAVAVFLYNEDSRTVVLTKQFRYAVYDKMDGLLPEIPAGKMDEGERPEETAVREIMEECGIQIEAGNLVHLSTFFASPGYTAEKYHLFFARFTNSQKVRAGGGLPSEHEYIEVWELPIAEFYLQVLDGKIPDAKTIMAALLVKEKKLIS